MVRTGSESPVMWSELAYCQEGHQTTREPSVNRLPLKTETSKQLELQKVPEQKKTASHILCDYEVLDNLMFHFTQDSTSWSYWLQISKSKQVKYIHLCHYQDKRETFVESFLIVDETWVYEFTPNETPWLGNILISPTTKKIEPSTKKNCDHVLRLWRPPVVWISPAKHDSDKYWGTLKKKNSVKPLNESDHND